MNSPTHTAQVTLERMTPSRCRVVLDNPPLNLMGPEFVLQIRELVSELESDERVKVVVFESAVDGVFLNHSDFLANFEDLTSIPQGPTGLEAWPDALVRLTRAPFVSIALIRGRATGNGSELALACDMSFASLEKALLSQWEVGAGLVAGGGPMARLPRLIGRQRALEVLLSSDDIGAADAERLGYVNRALPDAKLDGYVNALATRIASFDKWAIANTKRLVNEASLPPDVEVRAGWDACMASVTRPAAQEGIKALLEQGLQTPGDTQDRLGFHLGQLGLGDRKAYTSALIGIRTADLVPLVQPGAELYPLLTVSGGRYSAMGGGVPLTHEGQLIAGVGVSGGTTEQDIAIVEAAAG
jgi:enoyl-CoA hydratase/carnithine racemase